MGRATIDESGVTFEIPTEQRTITIEAPRPKPVEKKMDTIQVVGLIAVPIIVALIGAWVQMRIRRR